MSCHVDARGGGIRTSKGFSEMKEAGLLKSISKKTNFNRNTNMFYDGKLSVGADIRFQTTRSPISKDAERRYYPMQATVAAAYRPVSSVTFETSWNPGPQKFDGQGRFTASVIIRDLSARSEIRAGYFPPSVGVRYDDHTVLTRRTPDAEGAQSLIPPFYSEPGMEATWGNPGFLSLTAGIHGGRNLTDNGVRSPDNGRIPLIAHRNKPSYVGRIEARRRINVYNTFVLAGSSFLRNDDFTYSDMFAAAGIGKRASIIYEYAWTEKNKIRRTHGFSTEIAYRPSKSLIVYVRGERGIAEYTENMVGSEVFTNQGVAGTSVFLSPNLEVRPEYRIVDTDLFRATRYVVQLHLFY